ncbi:hypothetical protein NPIL_288601 [Nephila pilipes]|uniref:DUF4371 domain-containing protein n=1 Tax=Nephila pilipes TaxID=299642 RepID=A0A8X6N947_NEPPI|nr:hypothetical protein NPIL_288601 [Nephila pilipes]
MRPCDLEFDKTVMQWSEEYEVSEDDSGICGAETIVCVTRGPKEELCGQLPLKQQTRKDIANAVETYLEHTEINLSTIISIVTDGAKSMIGVDKRELYQYERK